MTTDPTTVCLDCSAMYPFGTDMVLTDEQWKMIHPDVHGLLCPSCIAKRADQIGVCRIRGILEWSND